MFKNSPRDNQNISNIINFIKQGEIYGRFKFHKSISQIANTNNFVLIKKARQV